MNIPEPQQKFLGQKLLKLNITEPMVKEKLDNLNQNKSAGADKHHPRRLIELKDLLVPLLTSILQKSLEDGFLPEVWKQANITPIYKQKGSKSSPTN